MESVKPACQGLALLCLQLRQTHVDPAESAALTMPALPRVLLPRTVTLAKEARARPVNACLDAPLLDALGVWPALEENAKLILLPAQPTFAPNANLAKT